MVGVIGLSTANIVERLRTPTTSASGVPDLAAVVGPAQRRRAAALLRRHVRRVPGRAVPALQPAAHEARPERRDYAGSSRRCPTSSRRRTPAAGWPRRGPDPPRRRAPALHGRGELPARRDVRRGVAAGVVRRALAADDVALFEAGDAATSASCSGSSTRSRGWAPTSGRSRSPGRTWTAPTTRCSSSSACCRSSRCACCRRTRASPTTTTGPACASSRPSTPTGSNPAAAWTVPV